MNLSVSDAIGQKRNRFPWGRFLGYTAVLLIIILTVKVVPDYLKNHLLHVKNGAFAQGLDRNLQSALSITPLTAGEINVDALAPTMKLHCGDLFEQSHLDAPFNPQTCTSDTGYLALHNVDDNILMHSFTRLTIFDGSNTTLVAHMGANGAEMSLPQQGLINQYLEGSLVESEWWVDGMRSNLIVPIYDEAETAVIGAIFIETPPPSGFFAIEFLVSVTVFYLPFALLIAYVVINLQAWRRKDG